MDLQVVLWPGLSGLGKNKDKDGLEQTEKTTIKTKINRQRRKTKRCSIIVVSAPEDFHKNYSGPHLAAALTATSG